MTAGAGDRGFGEEWLPIEARLREVEETYRVDRLRANTKSVPDGDRLRQVRRDVHDACATYLAAGPELRARMRELFRWSYLLPRYLCRRIHVPADLPNRESAAQALRIALAAASLEDNRTDSRDMLQSLGEVWLAAERYGLAPREFFAEAAARSSDEPAGSSMRRFLLGFHESAYFRSSVEPERGHTRETR